MCRGGVEWQAAEAALEAFLGVKDGFEARLHIVRLATPVVGIAGEYGVAPENPMEVKSERNT